MAVSGPCLSPWPAATALVALERARNALRKAIGGTQSVAADPNANPPVVAVLGIPDDDTIDRFGAVAAARVEHYAPMAPQAIKNEAVIRFAGYLRIQPSIIRNLKAGSVELDYAVSGFVRPFVNCGAKALLAPFVRRRALAAVSSE